MKKFLQSTALGLVLLASSFNVVASSDAAEAEAEAGQAFRSQLLSSMKIRDDAHLNALKADSRRKAQIAAALETGMEGLEDAAAVKRLSDEKFKHFSAIFLDSRTNFENLAGLAHAHLNGLSPVISGKIQVFLKANDEAGLRAYLNGLFTRHVVKDEGENGFTAEHAIKESLELLRDIDPEAFNRLGSKSSATSEGAHSSDASGDIKEEGGQNQLYSLSSARSSGFQPMDDQFERNFQVSNMVQGQNKRNQSQHKYKLPPMDQIPQTAASFSMSPLTSSLGTRLSAQAAAPTRSLGDEGDVTLLEENIAAAEDELAQKDNSSDNAGTLLDQ